MSQQQHAGATAGRDELWKLRAERAEAFVAELQLRLRSMQGELRAPEVILWRCPADGCKRYTYGADWVCIDHSHTRPVPVTMVAAASLERAREALDAELTHHGIADDVAQVAGSLGFEEDDHLLKLGRALDDARDRFIRRARTALDALPSSPDKERT